MRPVYTPRGYCQVVCVDKVKKVEKSIKYGNVELEKERYSFFKKIKNGGISWR
jgi:hypothetical protein